MMAEYDKMHWQWSESRVLGLRKQSQREVPTYSCTHSRLRGGGHVSQGWTPYASWMCRRQARLSFLQDFFLIFGKNLLPPSNMLKFASLMGLRAFLIVEIKEAATLLRQIWMEQFGGGNPVLAMEEASVGGIFCPNSRLKFPPLRGPFMS